MKAKSLYFILCLVLLFSIGYPASVHAASLSATEGVVGDEVTVYDLDYGDTYVIKWDGTTLESGTVPSYAEVNFTVPKSTRGSHTLYVYSPSGTVVLQVAFNVLPSISLEETSGNVGDSITVTGNGFTEEEEDIEITYDGDEIATDITANSYGYWTETIKIPDSYTGTHIFDAYGDETEDSYVANVTFTVEPAISISPETGNIGTAITVSGTGFTSGEDGISVIYDSTIVLSDITADSDGSWDSSFTVPSSAGGTHTIDASGYDTDDSDIADRTFTIAPSVTIDKQTGHVGDVITVAGSGFGQNESGIYVTFDNTTLGATITADVYGQWSVTRVVPSTASGIHSVSAYGSSTVASTVQGKNITISSQLTIVPSEGNVGDDISLTGSGFGNSLKVEISYGDTEEIATFTTDSSGNFSGSFEAPGGQSGQIQIIAKDSNSISASAIFNMETTPPALPIIKSPKDGGSEGFFGDTRVDFEWMPVTDPSGVTYDIQVSAYNDFQVLLIDHSELTTPEYRSMESEALPHGEYYWRIRAVDGAGNSSEWSEPYLLKTGFNTLILIIAAVVIVVLAIVIRAIVVFRKK